MGLRKLWDDQIAAAAKWDSDLENVEKGGGKSTAIKLVCDFILGPRTDVICQYCTEQTPYVQTDHCLVYVDFELDHKVHAL
jgi:hypothetical protein